jgi:ABC-2 type transport system permease protein
MTSLTGSLPLAELAARRDRIMLPAWIYVLAVLMVSTGYSFKKLYKTPQSREAVYSGIVHDPTVLALGGPLYGSSVGALTVYKYGAISALAAGLMSIFIVIRHTRADEESGRLELIGSTAVGRRAPLAVGVLLGAAANCVLALLMGAGLAAIGLPAGGAFAIGLAVGTCGLVFVGVAAVTAQLSASARGARAIAICVLAASYLVMSAGAAAGTRGGMRWLLWLSPVGWATQVRAFAGNRWAVLALPLACAVVVTAVAAVLAARRDLGTGRDRPPRAGGCAGRSPSRGGSSGPAWPAGPRARWLLAPRSGRSAATSARCSAAAPACAARSLGSAGSPA